MNPETELKKTPLYAYYQEEKIKLVDFGGWALPMQFTSILEEHRAVRKSAGLFDCSHMGEFQITGKDAEQFLDKLLTNNVSGMSDGQVQYNLLCNEEGGTLDDIMLYRINKESFLIVCNAANTEKVANWLEEHEEGETEIKNLSDEIGLIALQGPEAEKILQPLTDAELTGLPRHKFLEGQTVAGIPSVLISRTGYTGEDGFELYPKAEDTQRLWESLLPQVKAAGGLPCGLGSRDTLRLEAGLPLYGHELSENISPLEAGLAFAVKTNKNSPFIGKEKLTKQKKEGAKRKNIAFILEERGIPRAGYPLLAEDGQEIGEVTSGTQSPMLEKGIGMALVEAGSLQIGEKAVVKIRNKMVSITIVKKPFYKKETTEGGK